MEVTDFSRQKKTLLGKLLGTSKVITDKKLAIIDLKTGEKGFTFKANGTTDIQPDEGDGMVTLKVPHKTTFLIIQHPDYGQLTWKVLGRRLKKKKHYQGTLLTFSPDKEYKLQKQWVVFDVEPSNAILTVDSTTLLVRAGEAQLSLPIGKHTYRVESPFYEAMEDSIELTDSAKLFVPVTLQALYSYLTVKTSLLGCDIQLDGKTIGKTTATSGHLQAGIHRLTVFRNKLCYYDREIAVERNEKKVIVLANSDLSPHMVSLAQRSKIVVPASTDTLPSTRPSSMTAAFAHHYTAPVTIMAPNDSTEILVDLEPVGYGKWEGILGEGFHAITTREDSVQSHIEYLWIDNELPKTLNLLSPKADYGMLNIHSNVIGADIYVNDVKIGMTPYTMEGLPGRKTCRIRLRKEGYHDGEKTVKVIGNDLVDVNIKLKQRKK